MTIRGATLTTTLLAAMACAASGRAEAQPVQGLYIGAAAGYGFDGQQTITRSPFEFDGAQLSTKGGFAGGGSIGYGLGNGLRFEVEGVYLRVTANKLKPAFVAPAAPASGYTQTYGVFANALYDFNLGVPFFYPYIGAGVGYAWTNLPSDGAESVPGTAILTGTSGNFVYQGIAGFAVPIPALAGLSLTGEYHYVRVPGTSTFSGRVAGLPGRTFTLDFSSTSSQAVLVGLRYAFNTPSPPPPPPAPVMAPAPAPARTYLVFFDWDRYTLTPRAKEIIAEAADNSTHVQYTQIEVNGYTDTSGTPSYNLGLSIRRAKSVQAQLIADGVPASAISIAGYGETHLLVPTGPGVREPQNRRVEIIIQ